uniref:Protein NIM1-INTERACTING 2 n=1 Tax=Cajanus cajan TaxID=3821 RepID=A0A151UI45_CAJCA
MSNEPEKRKRAANDAVSDTHKNPAPEVTDEEVEEFSAILRRMNTAVKYFRRGGASRGRWTESLEEEIVQEVKQKTGVRNLGLDLNQSPQQE